MKLLIDVEKDYYEMIKYNVEHGQEYKPFEIIANGIPYDERPQGEWIEGYHDGFTTHDCSICGHSKESTHLQYNFCPNCGADMRGNKMINEESLKAWEQDHIEFLTSREMGEWLYRRDKNRDIKERPQGEWIDTGSGQECNICHEIQYGYDNFRHFCANCGAEMKGGAE